MKKLPIPSDATTEEMFDRLSVLGAEAMLEAIDGLLAGTQHGFDNARAAGADQQTDQRALVHDLGRVQGGLDDGGDQDGRSACSRAGAVDQVDGIVGCGDGVGMRIEDHTVAGHDHADAVADDGFRRVCRGSDRADHAERGHFRKRETVIAGLDRRSDVLGPRRLVRDQVVLGDLVIHAAHLGFGDTQSRHGRRLQSCQATDLSNDFLPIGQGHRTHGLVAFVGGRDGVVHILEDTDQLAPVVLGCIPVGRGLSGSVLHLGQNILYDLIDLSVCPVNSHLNSPESNLSDSGWNR